MDMEDKVHAVYSASSSNRWVNCPGSIKLIERAPEQKSGAAAEEGTRAHYLMEQCLIHDTFPSLIEGDFDPDMVDYVWDFVKWVKSLLKPGFELLVEEKVQLDFIHPTQAFGTVDVAIIEPWGQLHVIDFKYGRGFVDHVDNTQMIYYALGLAHKHHYDFESIKTTIYQPRSGSLDVFRSDEFSVVKLRNWTKVFKDAVKACEKADPDRDLHPGDWCKFCPATILCPAISKQMFDDVKLDFLAPMQPAPNEFSIQELKTILDRSAYLKLWIKEVQAYAEQKVRLGQKIPGWTLVPTKPQRVWRDVTKVLKTKLGSSLTMKDELVSPAKAEKVLKTKLTKSELQKFMNEHVVTVSSGDKLASNDNYFTDLSLDDIDSDF